MKERDRGNINITSQLFNREIGGNRKVELVEVCYIPIWAYPGQYDAASIKEFFRGDNDKSMRDYLPPGLYTFRDQDQARQSVIKDMEDNYADMGKNFDRNNIPSNAFWILKVKGKEIDIHQMIQSRAEGFGSKILEATNADGSITITKDQVLKADDKKSESKAEQSENKNDDADDNDRGHSPISSKN